MEIWNLMNEQTRKINTNVHLGKGKRKAEHHELNYGNFKRIKLDNHSNTRFRTSKEPFREDGTWGDLVKNYTDITKGTDLYKLVLSKDISTHWVQEPDIVNNDTVISKTWDDDFNCTTCTTPHPVINKWTGLVLAVTDQHFPAYLPPCDGGVWPLGGIEKT